MYSQFLGSTVQQAALSPDCWGDKDLWYPHSFVSNAVWMLPNPKEGFSSFVQGEGNMKDLPLFSN